MTDRPEHPPGVPLPPAPIAPGYTGPVPPGALAPPALPAPARPPYVLAGWWQRAGATAIDGLIIGVLALLMLAIFGGVFSLGFFGGRTAGTVSLVVGLSLGLVAVIVASLVYAPVLMERTNGQTWGKQALRIRVIRISGEPTDFAWSAMREIAVKTLGLGVAGSFSFGLAYLLDYLWPLWDDEHRALHDMVASSRVIRS